VYEMMFDEISLYLTNKCNSTCKTCNFWKNKDILELPIIAVAALINRYQSQGTLFVFGGGEPFLWSSISYLEHLCSSLPSMKYIMLSNLKLVDKVLASSFNTFTVSWDGILSDSTRYRGCNTNLLKFLRNKKNKQARIAYTLSKYNFNSFLKHDYASLKDYTDIYSLNYPYLLLETDLSYFSRSNTDPQFGFTWLFERLKDNKNEFFDKVSQLKLANYTEKALKNIEKLDSITCSNPFHSLHVSWDGKIRFCPGTRWDEKIASVYEFLSDLPASEKKLKDKVKECFVCKDITKCGVGCRFHVDAKEFFKEKSDDLYI